MKNQRLDLKQKKHPQQGRSRATVEAITQAATRLLIERGYQGLTTNAVAAKAGVSIGSLYEYFPGKEAIVAAAITRLIEANLQRLEQELEKSLHRDFDEAMRHWVRRLYRLVQEQRKILRVMLFQVPFLHEIPAVRNLRPLLLQFMLAGAQQSNSRYRINPAPVTLYLVANMTAATLLQLALMPPTGLPEDAVLDTLSARVSAWLKSGE